MIIEFLLNIVWLIIKPFIDLLPDLDFVIETGTISAFVDVLTAAAYLLPMDDILSMVGIVIGLNVIRIIIAFIKMIWSLLPFV